MCLNKSSLHYKLKPHSPSVPQKKVGFFSQTFIMFGEKGFYCLCITCCVIRLSGVNGFGFFIVCVFWSPREQRSRPTIAIRPGQRLPVHRREQLNGLLHSLQETGKQSQHEQDLQVTVHQCQKDLAQFLRGGGA